jgi:hypothetical protein
LLFVYAFRLASIAHFLTHLHIVVGDPDSVRIPQKDIIAPRIREIELSRPNGGASSLPLDTLLQVLSRIRTDSRPALRICGANIHGREHDLGQYVNVVEGATRLPGWSVHLS